MTIKENVILKKRAYLDLIDKYHYAKIETDIQDGNIVMNTN